MTVDRILQSQYILTIGRILQSQYVLTVGRIQQSQYILTIGRILQRQYILTVGRKTPNLGTEFPRMRGTPCEKASFGKETSVLNSSDATNSVCDTT